MSDEATIKQKLIQLGELCALADLLNIQKKEAINKVLPPEIRAELAAIEIEFGDQIEAITQTLAVLETEIKLGVIALGETVKEGGYQAVFTKGKTSWDSKKLEGYALAHPEIAAAKKVGDPSVSLKRVS